MSSEEIMEVIGQGLNLQNEDLQNEDLQNEDLQNEVEEAYEADGDDNGGHGHPEGNEDLNGVLEPDNNQGEYSSEDEVGETTPPRAPTPMPLEDQSVSTGPYLDRDWRDIGSPEEPQGEFALSPESQPNTPQHEDEYAGYGDGNPFPVEEPPAEVETGEPGNSGQGSQPSGSEGKSTTELDLPGTSYEKVGNSMQPAFDSLGIHDALEPKQPKALQPTDGNTPSSSFASPPTPEDSDSEEKGTTDTPSVARPPTPEESSDEEEEKGGDGSPPPKKSKF